jgi:mannosylglycerate hydrolase MGH1-like protein
MPYALDDFAFDLRRAVSPADIWVGSGTGTVAPLAGTVCGVGGWFAPPYAVPDGRLTVTLDVAGVPVADAARPGAGDRGLLYSGGTWWPDRVVRHGTYHQYRDGRLRSIAVRSTLTPGHGAPGYLLEIAVRNRADRAVAVTLRPEPAGTARHVPLSAWGWMPPDSGTAGPPVAIVHNGLSADLAPGAETTLRLAAGVGPAPDAELTTRRWADRIATALHAVPEIDTDIDGLDEYYRRSLASGLVCLWDHPDFATRPFVATSGLDGGALCGYAWDTGGYAPHLLSLLLGGSVVDVIEALTAADLTNHYAIAPDGTGLGVAYAYSAWSLVCLGYAAAGRHRVGPDLVTRLYAAHQALDGRFDRYGVLRDYGDQHNLLEMRGAGWEHVVASPNAERAAALDMLAELSGATGAGLPVAELRSTARQVRAEVVRQLWDGRAGWFTSRYPDGHTELAYSIQAYDALRAGACPPPMAAALLSRLTDDDFLGEYGVSSVSARDGRHYELGDTDWSGGGAYTGEGPQLALTLWERNESELAWDVLRRLLWMGRHFPYFPQEHYCDRPAAPPTGRRANIVAGLAGAEAIVTGLAGVRTRPDGALLVHPRPIRAGTVHLRGLRHRGRTVDVLVEPGRAQVTVDGRTLPTVDGAPVPAIPAS